MNSQDDVAWRDTTEPVEEEMLEQRVEDMIKDATETRERNNAANCRTLVEEIKAESAHATVVLMLFRN